MLFTAVLSSFIITGCTTTGAHDGALLGGLLGAGAGAIIGNQPGDAGEGALIGAGLGAITGAIIGDSMEKSRYTTREVVYVQPPPQVRTVLRTRQPIRRAGHYEMHLVRGPSGETYEERVWVYDN
jgi:uncharacterized protein YcfJ